jgi:hypothetical protein
MKKIIAAGRAFVGLDGEPLRETKVEMINGKRIETKGEAVLVGKTLANLLMQSTGQNNDEIKMYLLSIELHKGKDLEVDAADFKTLSTAIEKIQTNRITKAQIQLMMDEAKEVDEKGKAKK